MESGERGGTRKCYYSPCERKSGSFWGEMKKKREKAADHNYQRSARGAGSSKEEKRKGTEA